MVYGLKVINNKKGKRYGPYPREPDIWYLYESYREKGVPKKRFLGKGRLPEGAEGMVQERARKSPVGHATTSTSTQAKSTDPPLPSEIIADFSDRVAEVVRLYREGRYSDFERNLLLRSSLIRHVGRISKTRTKDSERISILVVMYDLFLAAMGKKMEDYQIDRFMEALVCAQMQELQPLLSDLHS